MTETELKDALDGLHAYDTGSRDSGIHDERLRQRVIDELTRQRGPHEVVPRVLVSRTVRELYLSDEALEEGYGIEDVAEFIKWLDEKMGFPL